ncbi:MAG: hypothetical protein SWE60_02785 [Thermodesulfobacteriota bacterium]|nr:hypothetical protein [Thermodesulfobacteriota bacterium]
MAMALSVVIWSTDSFAETRAGGLELNAFLASAEKDYGLKDHRELVNYLENAPGSTPYLDKVEFRTETEDFDIDKQEYTLRFYLKGWGETVSGEKLSERTKEAARIEHEAYFNRALRQRYELILQYLETASLLRLKHEVITLYEDRISVLKKQSGSSLSFDVNALIAAQDAYTDLRLEVTKLESQMSNIRDKINLAAGSEEKILFNEEKMISVEEIGQMIKNLPSDSEVDNIYLRQSKCRVELAEVRYHLEKAKDRDYLSFVEVSYDTNESAALQEAFCVQLGFRLPFITSDREDTNRIKASYLKEKLKYEEEKRATLERVVSLCRSVEGFIRQYHILADMGGRADPEASLKTYMKTKGVDPLELLELRESILKTDIRLNEISYQIRYQFVELMDIVDKLPEKPLKNYISANMEEIS